MQNDDGNASQGRRESSEVHQSPGLADCQEHLQHGSVRSESNDSEEPIISSSIGQNVRFTKWAEEGSVDWHENEHMCGNVLNIIRQTIALEINQLLSDVIQERRYRRHVLEQVAAPFAAKRKCLLRREAALNDRGG